MAIDLNPLQIQLFRQFLLWNIILNGKNKVTGEVQECSQPITKVVQSATPLAPYEPGSS